MGKNESLQRPFDGLAFDGQLTELDSFFKAMRIIHYKALNASDREEMLECTAAMDGVLDRTVELFEELREDILSHRPEA